MILEQRNSVQRIVLIGAGGAGAEALWVARRMNAAATAAWDVIGFADDAPGMLGRNIEGAMVLGGCAQIVREFGGQGLQFHCAIGNNKVRRKIADYFEANGFKPASLVDPQALIAESAVIEPGAYLAAQSVVSVRARVGRHVIINFGAMVGHDSRVWEFAQLCPGSRMNGNCSAGIESFLGANAAMAPGVSLGQGAILGACSFATGNVEPSTTALGVPARPIFSKKA